MPTVEQRISEIQEVQEGLRMEIDSMPHGAERERKIDLLMKLHDEICELHGCQGIRHIA